MQEKELALQPSANWIYFERSRSLNLKVQSARVLKTGGLDRAEARQVQREVSLNDSDKCWMVLELNYTGENRRTKIRMKDRIPHAGSGLQKRETGPWSRVTWYRSALAHSKRAKTRSARTRPLRQQTNNEARLQLALAFASLLSIAQRILQFR